MNNQLAAPSDLQLLDTLSSEFHSQISGIVPHSTTGMNDIAVLTPGS